MTKQFTLTNRAIFVLSLFGVLISSYLLYTYLAKTPIVCVDTGCETVRESPYAYVLGIPLPAFGLIMYVFVLIVSFLRTILENNRQQLLASRLIFVFALVGFLTSAYLTYLEAFVIKAYCIWCVASAIIITIIFLISAFEIRRPK